MCKKISLKTCKDLTKMNYTIYENNKILIANKYNKYGKKKYLDDILKCFSILFYGIISIIGFPVMLICILFSFIPIVYIKDGDIDKEKFLKEKKVNEELERRFNNEKIN